MGRTREELAEIRKLKGKKKPVVELPWPVENKDYYILRLATGDPFPDNWVLQSNMKSLITRERVVQAMQNVKSGLLRPSGPGRTPWKRTWVVVLGAKPDPKWGPVMP